MPFDEKPWKEAWPKAQALWSRFLRLREPEYAASAAEAKREGLEGSFAMIRLDDHRIVVSGELLLAFGVHGFPLEILAHEIGHHVLCPADLDDNARLLVRLRKALKGMERHAPMVGNLYADLVINDRLFRRHGLRMDGVYRALLKGGTEPSALWSFYMRTYELLWNLPNGDLGGAGAGDEIEGGAQVARGIIRSYANDWMGGASRFAMLVYPYLSAFMPDARQAALLDSLSPSAGGDGAMPDGLARIEEGEDPPSWDEIFADGGAAENADENELPSGMTEKQRRRALAAREAAMRERGGGIGGGRNRGGGGQFREPSEFREIMRSLGIRDDDAIAARYYRERAIPHLLPFPRRELPHSVDPLPEGLDLWEPGSPVDRINWVQTLIRGPVLIPGLSLYETHFGEQPGGDRARESIDLDLYVDSSGSMPNPRSSLSYLALAGAIICLSALRSGSSVRATLWSGPGEVLTTKEFVRDEKRIFAVLTGYFGGSTAFPTFELQSAYDQRPASARAVHILHISDEGITTILGEGESVERDRAIAKESFAKARGGGTMVLNLCGEGWKGDAAFQELLGIGYRIHPVKDWSSLVEFARRFAAENYSGRGTSR